MAFENDGDDAEELDDHLLFHRVVKPVEHRLELVGKSLQIPVNRK